MYDELVKRLSMCGRERNMTARELKFAIYHTAREWRENKCRN